MPKGADILGAVFGKAKGGSVPPEAEPEMSDDDEIPPDFEAAATEAFPSMTHEQMAALKRAIEACKGSY